jgi:type II secretory pathway component GspD/PulD (secretin)
MIKPTYVRIILCILIVALCLSYEKGLSQKVNNNQPALNRSGSRSDKVDVGREDPFSQFQQEQNPSVSQAVSDTNSTEKDASSLFVETVTLKFLDAQNLKSVIEKMSSENGSISIDEKSNSLIVCDTKENLEKILTQIRKADKTPEQIMIEVVILDVQLGDDTEIGVDWTRFFDPERDQSYTQDVTPDTFTTGGLLTLTKNNIIGTVRALQAIRNVEILASPRILVASGQDALIQTVEEIPYIELTQSTGGAANNAISSTAFKEAGVTLKVKATVANDQNDQKILMTIEPEQSINTGVTGLTNTTVPIVDKRKAKTTLIMEDGQVLIMGGLRKKEIRLTKNQIPLLGDIPLVGFLFSYDKRDVQNSELIVLISPHINKGEPVPEDAMKKFNELREKPLLSLPPDWRDPFRNIGKQPQRK